MSDMNGNEYAASAGHFTAEATLINEWKTADRAVIAANAQALATLALAYEQRTANLIAIATMNPQWYGSTSQESFDQIDARLGLNKKED